jgi:glutamine amidotransferase
MIGFISSKPIEVAEYFEAVKKQAQYGKHAPHKDGWGFATYGKDEFNFKKSLKPIWEDVYKGPSEAEVAVIHARQASPNTKIIYQNAHPFVFQQNNEIWSLIHNGGIKSYPNSWGNELDSKIIANLIEGRIRNSDALTAVKDSVNLIKENCVFSSINFFLASSKVFIVLRLSDDSHKLFYKIQDDLFEVSTEPVETDWIEMENSTIFYVQKIENTLKIEKIRIFAEPDQNNR